MTFSLLAYEPEEGTFYGASATGTLCVGGWVLRGDSRVGLTASQGADPSTLWGEDILKLMIEGYQPEDALDKITQADKGREHRQVAVIGNRGVGAVFSGMNNLPIVDSIVEDNCVLSGNILQSNKVLSKMREAYFEESKCDSSLFLSLRSQQIPKIGKTVIPIYDNKMIYYGLDDDLSLVEKKEAEILNKK